MIDIKIKINNKEVNIDILNEFLFPKIFGEKGCEEETLYLINTFTKNNFTSLTYIPNEIEGRHKGNKKSSTDILAITNDNTIINLEAQKRKQKKFHKRSHFYSSRIYSVFLGKGQNYEELPKVTLVNILDFNLHQLDKYHSKFTLCEESDKECTIDDIIETHYLELTKIRKKLKQGKIDYNNSEERLLLLMDETTPKKIIKKVITMDKFANKIYNNALHVLQDRDSYLAYIRAEQAELDQKGQMRYVEEKGREEGRVEGREETELEIAIKLKNEGIPVEIIAETTNLSLSKIKKL